MNAVEETLAAAQARIDAPWKWTQFLSARDDRDRLVDAQDPAACKFCGLGAIWAVADYNSPAAERAMEFLERAIGSQSFSVWQDAPNRTHAEVMAAFTRAIELARAGL